MNTAIKIAVDVALYYGIPKSIQSGVNIMPPPSPSIPPSTPVINEPPIKLFTLENSNFYPYLSKSKPTLSLYSSKSMNYLAKMNININPKTNKPRFIYQ